VIDCALAGEASMVEFDVQGVARLIRSDNDCCCR